MEEDGIAARAVSNVLSGLHLLHGPGCEDDPQVLLPVLHRLPDMFEVASERLQHDPNFVMRALVVNPSVIEFVPNPLLEQPDFACAICSHNGAFLPFLSSDLKDHKEVVDKLSAT